MSDDIEVCILNESKDIIKHNEAVINILCRQLSSRFSSDLKASDIERMVSQEEFYLVGALIKIRKPEEIVGLGIIFFRKILMGHLGFVHDVVVKKEFRGAGIATDIGQFLIKMAIDKNVSEIHLTSGNHRKTAHKLWLSLGFEYRDSAPLALYLNKKTSLK